MGDHVGEGENVDSARVNKRRLVSNHVPHHKDGTNQKFQVLSDKKDNQTITKVDPKAKQTGNHPSQQISPVNNASMPNDTITKKVTSDLLSVENKEDVHVR